MSTAIIFQRNQFPMPSHQSFWCHNSRNTIENLSADCFRFDGKAATLVIGESNPARTDLLTEDTIFFEKVFNGMLLMLIQPAGEREQQESKRIQT
jgi:hypothetical protein